MKTELNLLIAVVFLAATSSALATVRYVDVNGANPTPPYTNWAAAALTIQQAVDAAVAGDEIVVTNGTYTTGGRAVYGTMTNRVAVDRPLAVRSVNGPQFTVIQGCQVAGTINGDGAIRCVYLAGGAKLSGFTLTNGATRNLFASESEGSGGGLWCESATAVVSNCVLTGNSACWAGGGMFQGTLNNCTLAGNSAHMGGGAYYGTLNNSTLTGNSAQQAGGGALGGSLSNCTVTGNSSTIDGGGTYSACLNNCTVSSNTAGNSGGGACNGTLNNCTLISNLAYAGGGAAGADSMGCAFSGNSASQGGGVYHANVWHCAFSGNSAGLGGGVYDATVWNCTLTYNSGSAGGASSSTLVNCIVYYNTRKGGATPANYDSCTLNYCCTTPQPAAGTGNIAVDPQLASTSHLSATSPCRGAGTAAYASGTDIDGEAWANPPSIGCDEYHAGAVTGPLNVRIEVGFTNLAVGYPVSLTAVIGGRTSASTWDFGDGVVTTNQPYTTHAWTAPGDYPVVLRAYNESYPEGVAASVTVQVVGQPVHYVSVGSLNPQPPYMSWDTAATTIQQAVDAAAPGAEILVTNGIYAAGGRAVYGTMTNRVAVDKPLAVRSVNGPQVTVIQGHQVPPYGYGDASIRCVYLTNGATLSGFTLTNGATRSAGDTSSEQSGGGLWCESTNALATNCIIVGNSASYFGGGSYYGTLNNCTLSGNSALVGGCGGGAAWSTLSNCTLTGNSVNGYYDSSYDSYVGGCGGGAYWSTLNNCTLIGNSASYGGGAYRATLNNCIVYFNSDPNGGNYDGPSVLDYCCTTPQPTTGTGNISVDPQLASTGHLSATSPCRGAGSTAYASGTDIDGEAWANPPSIGCDEYHAGAVTGPLSVGILAPFTNVVVGYPLGLTAVIGGRTVASVWDFGDGLVVSNWPCAAHVWTTAADYAVVLRAYNESHPEGVTASVIVHVVSTVHYVSAASPNPLPPYTNWATAAHIIQDAVDAAVVPGVLVLVTNGTYAAGGRAVGTNVLVNRVAVTKPLTVRSVNGPQVTVIRGYQVRGTTNGDTAIRCVYLTNGASLSGFTLTRGATQTNGNSYLDLSGGGVCCDSTNALVTNCVLSANAAYYDGGGAFNGTLNNCSLTCNWTWMFGGGAYGSTLNNCALTCNAADSGGGARSGILNNCTLEGNAAILGMDGFGGGAEYCILNNCVLAYNTAWMGGGTSGVEGSCTANYCIFYNNTASYDADYAGTVLDHSGTGDPLFADSAGRLQSGSPCINTGNNAYVTTSTDLDGNPRIVRGTVDIGAYEFQGPGSVIPFAWLRQYGLPTDGSADYTDPDGDGMNNWQEWICGTCPTNPLSALRLLSASPTGANVTVRWQSVAGVSYFLERATNLSPSPLFTPLATGIIGQPGTTSYTDTNVPGASPFFYRVGVGN